MDFFVNCTTGFYEKGILIKERIKIIRNYAKNGTFIMDLITFISIFFVPSKFALVYLYKILKIHQLINNLEKYLFVDDILFHTFSMIKLFINLVFISHLFACIWYYIGVIASSDDTS